MTGLPRSEDGRFMFHCSFCDNVRTDLCIGPELSICEHCTQIAHQFFEKIRAKREATKEPHGDR